MQLIVGLLTKYVGKGVRERSGSIEKEVKLRGKNKATPSGYTCSEYSSHSDSEMKIRWNNQPC